MLLGRMNSFEEEGLFLYLFQAKLSSIPNVKCMKQRIKIISQAVDG